MVKDKIKVIVVILLIILVLIILCMFIFLFFDTKATLKHLKNEIFCNSLNGTYGVIELDSSPVCFIKKSFEGKIITKKYEVKRDKEGVFYLKEHGV